MPKKQTIPNRDFIRVGTSKIHGHGVFAKRKIPKGTRIVEYCGDRILKDNLLSDFENGLTSLRYVLSLTDDIAIDGERNGNDARFINHCCQPNCEVYIFDDIPYIYAMEEIPRWKEITFDYKLQSISSKKLTKKEKMKLYPCNCGAKKCRGTLIVQ
ncbi:MAG: SET domain-containing protein-lysine N-methyltransferase [Ignavibacteriae bacterium]|nr:SET domain-containing protein-lysine N-methyltransferase [Ignavibacteriota bacterium]